MGDLSLYDQIVIKILNSVKIWISNNFTWIST